MTLDDYRALGRIEGAAHAQAAMARCVGWSREMLEQAQAARFKLLLERMLELQATGATEEEAAAFADAAEGRFYEALTEIRVAIEQRVAAAPELGERC